MKQSGQSQFRIESFSGKGPKVLFLYSLTLSICIVGFLSELFVCSVQAQSQNAQSTTSSNTPEDWAAYLTKINGTSVGSIIVNLELHKRAPIKDRPTRLEVDIKIQNPTKDGFYSSSEWDTMNQIDETLQSTLAVKLASIYAGHLVHDGHLFLYHYIKKGDDPTPIVSAVMSAFPKYKALIKAENDESWRTYFDLLYPEPIQMQSIQNGRLVEAIKSQGDLLEKPRRVDHWIYFTLDADREKFLTKLTGKGFKVESKNTIKATDGRPFQLHISRVDKITSEAVDEYVLELWQIAQDCNGDYDGWETVVVKK